MGYRLITGIQVYEGDSQDPKKIEEVKPGSRLTELDLGREFKAELVGTNTEISWIEVTDGQLASLDSRLAQLNIHSASLVLELQRSNLLQENLQGNEVSTDDVEG